MKKIAVFHNLPVGGAKRVLYQQIEFLRENNIIDAYEINSSHDSFLSLSLVANKVFSYSFPNRANNSSVERIQQDYQKLFSLRFLHKKIAADIDSRRYDFVLVHPDWLTQSPYLLRFLKTTHAYYCHELLRIVYEQQFKVRSDLKLPNKIYDRSIRLFLKNIDRQNARSAMNIFTNSRYTQQNVFEHYKKKADVIYPGVDTDIFKQMSQTKKYDVLFIGEESPLEGFDILQQSISAFRRKPSIKVLSKRLTNSWISDKELAKEYNSTKVLVALARNEPLGLIPLEAASCGVPVIAVNEGGYSETVRDSITGYLIPRDAAKLTEKIEHILSHPDVRIRFGKNGREETIRRWSWEKRIKELEVKIDEIIESAPRKRS